MFTFLISLKGRSRVISFFLIILFAGQLQAQTVIGRQKVEQLVSTSWGATSYALTWLPTDYANTSHQYPLIIFLHGKGETGDGLYGLYNLISTALPQTIANGWNPEAINPADGQLYKFIVVSPQAPTASQWSMDWNNLRYILPDIINKYRVDVSRIYITGLSAGGSGTWSCLTSGPAAAKNFAAAVPVAAAGMLMDSIANVGSRDKVKIWQICGTGDELYNFSQVSTNIYNSTSPAPQASLTSMQGLGHWSAVWNTAYDPSWRANVHGKNIYEWMLQYSRTDVGGSPAPAPLPNQSPIVHAGFDQSVTLPSSSVTLNGSATDADGSIVSYTWSQQSGPSAATILSPASATTVVSGLVEGSYTFKLIATDNNGNTGSATVIVTVTQSNVSSLRIEAENYVSMYGIQTENTVDVGGGLNVGWQDNGDWMDYHINIPAAGSYMMNIRVASYFSGAQFQVKKGDGSILTTVTVPMTGSFQSWQTVSVPVTLFPGPQTLRLFTSNANGGWNINWFEMEETSVQEPLPSPAPAASIKIEAENYSQMSGVFTEWTQDIDGGLNVGWQDNGDWMDYTVNITEAGNYEVKFRIASCFHGAQFQLRNNAGIVLATLTVPNTGGFQQWQTISANINLPGGSQLLRIITTQANGGWNINWFEITTAGGGSTPPPPPATSRIEAEDYGLMSGIQVEHTLDAGGGLNVGWQDNGDWMDYTVNVNEEGMHTLNFRVASFFTGAQFQVRNSNGIVLATITVPNTGGFQVWQTVSANVYLPAGQQVLRIYTSNANGGWNINWWEIESPGSSARGGQELTEEETTLLNEKIQFSTYPNPAKDRINFQFNHTYTGKIKVQLYDLRGALIKQYDLQKSSNTIQGHVNLNDLRPGAYLLCITTKDYNEVKMFIKQ